MVDVKENAIIYLKTLAEKIKPNPNHYPIVDKWNQKYVWNPNKYLIFVFIEKAIDEEIRKAIDDGVFEKFCDIKQIPY